MAFVMQTILNRVESDKFPNTIYDVVSNTKEEIILECFDNEIGMKIELVFENDNGISIEIRNDLIKKFLNRITSFTHLINEN